MFIFYLQGVDNNELIAKLFTDKFNLIAKLQFLLLILFTCLHFTIDRKLIFPKINEAKSRKPVNRLEERGRKAASKEEGWERKSIASSRACPTNLHIVVVVVFLLWPLQLRCWCCFCCCCPLLIWFGQSPPSLCRFLLPSFHFFCCSAHPWNQCTRTTTTTRQELTVSWAELVCVYVCVCVYCRIT